MKRFFGIFLSDGYKLAKMKSLYIGIAVMAVLVLVSALAVTGMAELYEEAYGENMIFGDGNGGIKRSTMSPPRSCCRTGFPCSRPRPQAPPSRRSSP